MINSACDFSFRHYRECLEMISQSHSQVEMIHDIDIAPDNLTTMASMEKEYSIQATYFIRLHSRTYNPFALPYLRLFQETAQKFGHKLGLHFEPKFYEGRNIREAITREAEALSFGLNQPISAMSIHEPARFGSINPEDLPSGMTYYCWNAPYYSGKKYISDSSVRWREGCMCQNLHHENLIILTHLDHWYVETSSENY